ncbi:helix-turn-helix domain-containing protein [Galbibacter pacificus]|uniref:Helix-turn-helix domain-containing protein n=1 Tax=Galbibacter pacificus TaxID=2996052 RepID=A0ABT6FN90_9FLAO|nr:helix-turn-helix domain-containing protein [Galbibacter pacificus]MDG3581248.1 helix-turn-helix domain-containing protein [Galbibacter pacificus]MDG3584726.1 helix-turn-helix domain-containing protein [Galbibacter pacificus]
MSRKIVTNEDLYQFKTELINEIKQILNYEGDESQKKWLKSNEVQQLLGISSGTLQNLRVNGTLPYSKIGGVLYYEYQQIINILENNMVNCRF